MGFTHALSLSDLFSMISLHPLQQKRGLQQTSGCRRGSWRKVSDFSLPSVLQFIAALGTRGWWCGLSSDLGVRSSPRPWVPVVTPGELLLEDILLWRWINGALRSDSFKKSPLKLQGNFNRILMFCLKWLIVDELLIFSLRGNQSSKSWVMLGGPFQLRILCDAVNCKPLGGWTDWYQVREAESSSDWLIRPDFLEVGMQPGEVWGGRELCVIYRDSVFTSWKAISSGTTAAAWLCVSTSGNKAHPLRKINTGCQALLWLAGL